jgi:hypothetical protein
MRSRRPKARLITPFAASALTLAPQIMRPPEVPEPVASVQARRKPDEPHMLDMEAERDAIPPQAAQQLPPAVRQLIRRRRRQPIVTDVWPALHAAQASSKRRRNMLLAFASTQGPSGSCATGTTLTPVHHVVHRT